jgi:ribosomal protein S18 acetylase RimI-like enzyme
MIRSTVPEDTPTLVAMADGTRVFKPMEIQALREVLDDYHAGAHAEGHRSVTCERNGQAIGFAYFAPVEMTDRTWTLWWIVVSSQVQARGVGSELLRHVEEEVRSAQGRLLMVETSSLPHYDLTRRFYLKQGYEQAAALRDYYADGDDMVIFRKRLIP